MSKLKSFQVKVTQTFVYDIEVEANSQREAIEQAKYLYENAVDINDGYLGVADGNSYDGVKFKIIKDK